MARLVMSLSMSSPSLIITEIHILWVSVRSPFHRLPKNVPPRRAKGLIPTTVRLGFRVWNTVSCFASCSTVAGVVTLLCEDPGAEELIVITVNAITESVHVTPSSSRRMHRGQLKRIPQEIGIIHTSSVFHMPV